ncbi:MAG TPA: copper chaperone [Thiotrichales bacterium]|nr:copper chaperone [Thiotrichales bacterium]
MATETFEAQNIKCGGCAQAIRDGLGDQPGVTSVEVEIESGRVTVSGENLDRASLAARLAELGYPERT